MVCKKRRGEDQEVKVDQIFSTFFFPLTGEWASKEGGAEEKKTWKREKMGSKVCFYNNVAKAQQKQSMHL